MDVASVTDDPLVAPGSTQQVAMTKGTWTLYAETDDGTQPADGVAIVTVTRDRLPVTVEVVRATVTYSAGSRQGRAVGSVDVPSDGTYDVAVADTASASIRVRDGSAASTLGPLAIGIGAAVLLGALSLASLVWVLVRRGRR